VSLCDPCSRLQIRRLIFNPIWHSFQNDLLSECNEWLAASRVVLVLEVAKRLARNLHISLDKVAADTRVKFVQIRAKYNIVFALHK
jgi:hypothetical protein